MVVGNSNIESNHSATMSTQQATNLTSNPSINKKMNSNESQKGHYNPYS